MAMLISQSGQYALRDERTNEKVPHMKPSRRNFKFFQRVTPLFGAHCTVVGAALRNDSYS